MFGFIADDTQHYVAHQPFHQMFDHNPAPQRRASGSNRPHDFAVLDVDQLAITYIVLAFESRLGIELPTHLEDARTVAELVAGARDALRANAATKGRLPESDELPLIRIGRPALRRNSGRRNLLELSPWRPRSQKFSNRATRV